jgi:hypothetical protein
MRAYGGLLHEFAGRAADRLPPVFGVLFCPSGVSVLGLIAVKRMPISAFTVEVALLLVVLRS